MLSIECSLEKEKKNSAVFCYDKKAGDVNGRISIYNSLGGKTTFPAVVTKKGGEFSFIPVGDGAQQAFPSGIVKEDGITFKQGARFAESCFFQPLHPQGSCQGF